MADQCPICQSESKITRLPAIASYTVECNMCKKYIISEMTFYKIKEIYEKEPECWLKICRWIRKHQSQDKPPTIIPDTIDNILLSEEYPNPQEQADNLILWFGDNLKYSGNTIDIEPNPFKAIIGAISDRGVQFILDSVKDDGLIEGDDSEVIGSFGEFDGVTLTLSGWQRYEELKHQSTDSYKAFMAMSFEEDLYCVYETFKKAVDERTGFELVRVDEHPKPGLVDDNIVVELRRARFVIADITNQNRGAYWEAGFAEGLGKPVIYSCRKKDFEDAHFDTNHRFTIVWDNEKLDEAAQRLVNMIRANIPGAKMEDDVGQSR